MTVSASFVDAKLEALLLNTASSLPSLPLSSFKLPSDWARRNGSARRVSFRCDGADQPSMAPSNVSALEQLKTSASDRYTKERSSIVVIGLSIHTTPVEMN